jgi:signal transduction histidine kinase
MNDKKLKNYSMIIHQESNKMLHQVTQLLHTAYYDNIKIAFRMRNHNIHGLTEFFLASYLSVFNESDIKVQSNFRAINPICSIDRTHYFNVVTNLLDNARKYSGEKRPEICISTYNENNKLYIEFSDNGIGIDHKHLEHIFDRFYRVPQGNKHEKSGYGVGLYYVKTVLNQMKADIRVKSRPGQGSTFLISIRNKKHT